MDDNPHPHNLGPACKLSNQVDVLLRDVVAEPDSARRLAMSRAAVAIGDRSVELTPATDRHRATHLSNLARALLTEYEQTVEQDVLDKAIAVAEQAVAASSDGYGVAAAHFSLGWALHHRYRLNSDVAVLTRALAALGKAERASEPDDPNLRGIRRNRAWMLLDLLHHAPGDAALYVDTVDAARTVTAELPVDDQDGFMLMYMLVEHGRALLGGHRQTDLLGWVASAAKEAALRAEALRPRASGFACILGPLSTILMLAAVEGRDADLIAAAVQAARAGSAAAPVGDEHHEGHLRPLVEALRTQVTLFPDLASAAVDEWVEQARRLVAATASDRQSTAQALEFLADGLMSRLHLTKSANDLPELVDVARRAVAVTSPEDPARAARLVCLRHALTHACDPQRNGGRRPDDDQLREWATVSRDLADATPREDAAYPGYARDASRRLAVWAQRSGDLTALDDAIELQNNVVETYAPEDPDRADSIDQLAELLEIRLGQRSDPGSPDSIALHDKIVAAREAAAKAGTADDPHRVGRLFAWSTALRRHPQAKADPALVDRKMEVSRAVLKVLPVDEREARTILMTNLVVDLRTRYEETGELDVLDDAERMARQAVSVARELPEDWYGHGFCLSNLGFVLSLRYDATKAEATLNEAITVTRAAVDASPTHDGSNDSNEQCLGCLLGALAGLLADRYALRRNRADFDDAVAIGRRAADATPRDHHEWACQMANLGARLAHSASGNRKQLTEGIQLLADAAAETPGNHPHHAAHLFRLGRGLEIPQRYRRNRVRRLAALDAYRRAATDELAPPSDRLNAARAWGALAARMRDWPAAADGYHHAVQLLPRVAGRELRQNDQQRKLTGFGGLASVAAACALQRGAVDDAVEILEYGRGILLTRALESRADLAEVSQVAPELARRLAEVRDEFDDWDPASHRHHRHDLPAEAVVTRRRALTREWDQLVARVRDLPGQSDFLRVPRVGDLLCHAREGPIALINVSAIRSDALCLTGNGLRLIRLPGVTPQAVHDKVATFHNALATYRATAGGGSPERDRAGAELRSVLHWLWDAVTGPVLKDLGSWARIWWVPTGELAFLPLHAAGYHEERAHRNPRTVLDRAVSSYTPTVRVLHDMRTRTRGTGDTLRTSLVAMPMTPGAANLPGAAHEADIVAAHYPGSHIIQGHTATHDSVIDVLRTSTWMHFACHARSDVSDPSASCVILNDYELTVAEISRLQLARAEFAYLSTCSTVRTTPTLVDEAIHITSAFHLAGFREIIGTMWEIRDSPAVRMADVIYGLLKRSDPAASGRAAYALHDAVHQARRRWWRDVPAWAAYIHVGT